MFEPAYQQNRQQTSQRAPARIPGGKVLQDNRQSQLAPVQRIEINAENTSEEVAKEFRALNPLLQLFIRNTGELPGFYEMQPAQQIQFLQGLQKMLPLLDTVIQQKASPLAITSGKNTQPKFNLVQLTQGFVYLNPNFIGEALNLFNGQPAAVSFYTPMGVETLIITDPQALVISPSPRMIADNSQFAARLAMVMTKQNLGQEAAELLIAQAMELRDTYSAGNVVGKADLQTMQAVLTDEEMQQAVNAYRVQHPDDIALVEDLPVNGGNRSWASGPMNDALDEVRAQLQQFTTGHHKVSKSRLASVLALMTPEQQTRAKTELDLPPGSGLNAFKSLGANLSTGPNSGLRIDEHGQALDGNRFEDGSSTPRTVILEQVDELVTQIKQARELDPATPLTELEFTRLLGMLVQAEKYHYLKTDGELLDTETRMWQELPQGDQQASLWRRKPVSPDAYPAMPDQFHDSVRDLKKPKYRSPQEKVYNQVPAVHQGDSYFDYSFGGVKYRPKHTYISQGPDTAENIETWAKAGYKATAGVGSVSLTRVMPVDLLAAFRTGIMDMGLPAQSPPLSNLISIMLKITKLKLGQGEYQGKSANFELIQDQALDGLAEIKQSIEEYVPEIEPMNFQQGKAMALRVLEIERVFVSGESQNKGAELADMFGHLPLWQ